MTTSIRDANLKPAGYSQSADLSTAVSLTVPANARCAMIQAVDNDVSWRDDGTTATVSSGGSGGGMILAAGDTLFYVGQLEQLSFIEAVAASTAYINVSFYI